MPPKTKRHLQLQGARDAKRRRSGESSNSTRNYEPEEERGSQPEDSVEDLNCSIDTEEKQALAQEFIQDWVSALSRDDLLSLSVTLDHVLVRMCGVKKTEAAGIIGKVIDKSERTVREWRSIFYENDGSFPDSQQGCYQRTGVLWRVEELNEAARDYVRQNAVPKGRPNMTSSVGLMKPFFQTASLNQDFPGMLVLTLQESGFMN